ncbi:MAG: hypothetical protein ACLFQB_04080 [Chitinispirillaceae bacterium]
MNNQYLTKYLTEPVSYEGLDSELDSVADNLEQALEALKMNSLSEEAAIVKGHVSKLRNPRFRQRCHRILKRRNLSPTSTVERVVDSLAATIID